MFVNVNNAGKNLSFRKWVNNMRERTLCKHYIKYHECKKGKLAETNGICTHCHLWEYDINRPNPLKPDTRRKKREKAAGREIWG